MFDDDRKQSSKRESFVRGLKSSRMDREAQKKRKKAALQIQSQVRRWLAARAAVERLRQDLDVKLANIQLLKRTLESANKAAAFQVPREIFLKLVLQFLFIQRHQSPRLQNATKGVDLKRLADLSAFLCLDVQSGECAYLRMPEAEEDALPLKKRLGEFERLVYAGLVSSPLTGEKHTFDALYACAIAMNPVVAQSKLVRPISRKSVSRHWWGLQHAYLFAEFTRVMSELEQGRREELCEWQRVALLNLFRLLCAWSEQDASRGWLLLSVLPIPNLFRIIQTSQEFCQSAHFVLLLNSTLANALHRSLPSTPAVNKVYTLGNILRVTSELQSDDMLQLCLQNVLAYVSRSVFMVGKVYEGTDMLLWEDIGRTKSATSFDGHTKDDLLILVEGRTFLKRVLSVSVDAALNEKGLALYHAQLEQQWETIQSQLQQRMNTQPSLDNASKSYLSNITDLWLGGTVFGRIGRPRDARSSSVPGGRKGVLRNTSKASASLAKGHRSSLLVSTAQLLSTFLTVVRPSNSNRNRQTLLNILSFGCESVPATLWRTLQLSYPSALQKLHTYNPETWKENEEAVHMLHVLAAVCNQQLMVADDVELYDQHKPLHRAEIQSLARLCKYLLHSGWTAAVGAGKEGPGGASVGYYCLEEVTSLMMSLHERNSRRPLCAIDDWVIKDLKDYDSLDRMRREDLPKFRIIMGKVPYIIPFKTRVKAFRKLIKLDKQSTQGPATPKLQLRCKMTVHRVHMFEDGFRQLDRLRGTIRNRLYITFVNELGKKEAGIDAGGLFKEFWTTLSKTVFNPEYGLFQCRANNELSPSPNSEYLHETKHLELFEFVGMIVGKALYENIVIQPTFAHTFLSRLLGKVNHLHELAYFDQELYRNLLYIKSFEGSEEEFRDLSLSFSVTVERLGRYEEVDLVPNGRNVALTKGNRLRYISRVGNYHLNLRTAAQTEAFRKGFFHCVNLEWIRIFSQPELQVLISGKQNQSFNLKDLKAHSRVLPALSFTLNRIHVSRFWKIMEEFSDEERTLLLKFVTSCEREPLLGFGELDPPFTIQVVSIKRDDDKLPTASTCFNVLKLPTYSDKRVMKQKILVAIKSESGFEMS